MTDPSHEPSLQDIFRKYPNPYESIIVRLCENLDTLDEPEAKGGAHTHFCARIHLHMHTTTLTAIHTHSLSFIHTHTHTPNPTLSASKQDIFRKYPNRYESIIGRLCENLDTLDEPEAKAAMIWILGEYAARIDNADEILEQFLENFLDEGTQVRTISSGPVLTAPG